MDQRWVQPKKSGCQKGGGVNTSSDRGVVKDMGVAATCNGIGRGGYCGCDKRAVGILD